MVLTALVRFPMTCSPAVRLLSVRLFAALSVRVCGDGARHAKVVHHALQCAPALLEHPERDDGQRHAEGLDQQATWSGLAMTSVPTSAGVLAPPGATAPRHRRTAAVVWAGASSSGHGIRPLGGRGVRAVSQVVTKCGEGGMSYPPSPV